MHKIFKLAVIVMILCVPIAKATDYKIYLHINDASIISTITVQGKPKFTIAGINTLIDQYTVTGFVQANPYSRLKSMRSIYSMIVNDLDLPQALVTNYPEHFGFWEEDQKFEPHYTPVDYPNIAGVRNTDYLEYIKARQAWDVNKGDRNMIIGIIDWELDASHPDLIGKPVVVNNIINGTDHGTTTAGLAAGHTDSINMGYPSIGFNCRFDFESCFGLIGGVCPDFDVFKSRKRRVVNFSGGVAQSDTLFHPSYYNLLRQIQLQEIYEDGTFFVASAGNHQGATAKYHSYPASYDYAFSVSGVGWKNTYASGLNDNVEGLHERIKGDSNSTFQHNSRVDLVAPAYDLGGLVRTPTGTVVSGINGTSGSAPLVAGTAGLILSEDSCYTPYQLEYILKQKATNISTLLENIKYSGRIGKGALNAGAALAYVRKADPQHLKCNDAATRTMYIEGVEFNSLCVPHRSHNGVKPQIRPIIVNGTPPYTARWEKMTFNKCFLNSDTALNPIIDSAIEYQSPTLTSHFHYRLTVYDASPIQKVASRDIEFQLTSGEISIRQYELTSRDALMDMVLDQPNLMDSADRRDNNFFKSPDLWNRQSPVLNNTHQRAEYQVSSTDSNYAFVRVRNVGCQRYDASATPEYVRIYWTVASTGEKWQSDWDGTGAKVNGQVCGGLLTTGLGIPIKSLNCGDTAIIRKAWKPVNPSDYGTTNLNVCLLSRIVNTSNQTSGITIQEQTGPVIKNVRNNNNIVTRNLWIENLKSGKASGLTRIYLANAEEEARNFDIQFINDKEINRHFAGNFSEIGYVTLYLGELYNLWLGAGGEGTYLSRDDENQTVTMDGSTTLELLNIPLGVDEKYPIDVEFSLRNNVVIPDFSFEFHLRQFMKNSDGQRMDGIYGSMSFQINTEADADARKASFAKDESSSLFTVYPNPATDNLHLSYNSQEDIKTQITIVDIIGRKLIEMDNVYFSPNTTTEISITKLPPGIYIVEIIDGKTIRQREKFVKQ